jgi:hypothetical protein
MCVHCERMTVSSINEEKEGKCRARVEFYLFGP